MPITPTTPRRSRAGRSATVRWVASCLALVIAAVGLLLVSTGCPPSQPRTPAPKVGEPLREIGEEYLSGIGPRSLAEARGMVVIVEFWATYCDPCLRSFPAYQKLHERGGVAVISVALDEPSDIAAESIKEFTDKTGATFAVLWDKDQSTIDTFGLRKMPTAFVVDHKGVLRHVHGGYNASTAAEIEAEVEKLLAEMPQAATEPAPAAPAPTAAPSVVPSAAPTSTPSAAPSAP